MVVLGVRESVRIEERGRWWAGSEVDGVVGTVVMLQDVVSVADGDADADADAGAEADSESEAGRAGSSVAAAASVA